MSILVRAENVIECGRERRLFTNSDHCLKDSNRHKADARRYI
jgi:hypothetical protein